MFGPDDAFLTTVITLLRRLPIYQMFGRGLTRLQPADVEDVAEAIARALQRTQRRAVTFECAGPRVYSYEEFLRAVAHEAGLKPILIPLPFAVWHALIWIAEMLPSPPITRNQVELMQVDTVASPAMPGFEELGISTYSGRCNGRRSSIYPRIWVARGGPLSPRIDALDEALKNTFPASDPVSVEQPTTSGRASRS
jgi:NADH dehydrogenase